MLLGREKELRTRPTSQSKDKNKSMVRVASSSKLPKDFFKNDTVHTEGTVLMRKRQDMLEFTFMTPMQPITYSTVKTLKKCAHLKSKPSLRIANSNAQSFTECE